MAQLHRQIGFLCAAVLLAMSSVGTAQDATPAVVSYLVVDDKTDPFQIIDGGESVGGIISDIVDQIFVGTGLEVQHQVLPVNRLTYGVSQHQFDNWIAFDAPVWDSFGGLGEYTERPLFVTRHILLTCDPKLPSPVTSIDQLEGMSVATLRHFRYLGLDAAAQQGIVKAVPVENFQTGLNLVSLGRVDGFVEMQSRLRFHLGGFAGDRRCMREVDFSAIIPDYPVYLAMDRRMPASIKATINRRLREMEAAGDLQRIWEEYVPVDLPIEILIKARR